MSKVYEAGQDKEIERIEGEEGFMNEPSGMVPDDRSQRKEQLESVVKWAHELPNRSETSQRALDQLDYSSVNANPLD
jgi:hypothetical protein